MNEPKSKVFLEPAEDPEMGEAMKKARASFKYLWRELTWEYRRIVPALQLAAIKAAFRDGPGASEATEHMWLNEIAFDGEAVRATLVNSPNDLTSVREGDRIAFRPDELEDWMYVLNGRVYGGFTVQVQRSRMSPRERREHDDAWGFDFGDPAQVALAPDWSAKEKSGVLGRLFGSSAAPSDPDGEHAMSENMAKKLREEIGKHRAAFLEEATGDEQLTVLHSLALGGSAACVRVLLENGANPLLKTRSGKTARELAEQMGWPGVVELLRAAESKAQLH